MTKRHVLFSRTGFLVSAVLCLLFSSSPVFADTITYTYTGNAFTDFNGFLPSGLSDITGSFSLSNALGANSGGFVSPLSFSFTDGATTLTQFNSLGASFFITTDAAGAIATWLISLDGPSNFIFTQNGCVQSSCFTIDETAYFPPGSFSGNAFNGNPGTWSSSSTTVVPEPSSLILLGTGLLGLGLVFRRRFAGPRHS